MRIYTDCRELMSELGRNIWEMGVINKPKTYQNKDIEGNEDFVTKELICEQYCLTTLSKEDYLFSFDHRSKEWTKQEFLERVDGIKFENPGEAWKLRKELWEQFLDREGKFDYTYHDRFYYEPVFGNRFVKPNIKLVINLLQKDPDTRKAILPIFSLDDMGYSDAEKRIPCSMYYDFLIRKNNGESQLNICYHQRSSDFVTHFGNDVYLAWQMMLFVTKFLKGVKPGYLFHTIDSLHSYKKDWGMLKSSIDDIYSNNFPQKKD